MKTEGRGGQNRRSYCRRTIHIENDHSSPQTAENVTSPINEFQALLHSTRAFSEIGVATETSTFRLDRGKSESYLASTNLVILLSWSSCISSAGTFTVMVTSFNLGHAIAKFDDEMMTTWMGSRAKGRGTAIDTRFSRLCSR